MLCSRFCAVTTTSSNTDSSLPWARAVGIALIAPNNVAHVKIARFFLFIRFPPMNDASYIYEYGGFCPPGRPLREGVRSLNCALRYATTVQLRPESLAAYSARSARAISDST